MGRTVVTKDSADSVDTADLADSADSVDSVDTRKDAAMDSVADTVDTAAVVRTHRMGVRKAAARARLQRRVAPVVMRPAYLVARQTDPTTTAMFTRDLDTRPCAPETGHVQTAGSTYLRHVMRASGATHRVQLERVALRARPRL